MAAVVRALAALAYFAPLLAGRQMGHGYLLYESVPWQASKPPGLDTKDHSANRDVAVQNYPWTALARSQLARGEERLVLSSCTRPTTPRPGWRCPAAHARWTSNCAARGTTWGPR